jgi:hypothetical protein
MSLEKAVAEIKLPIDKLPGMLWTAKRNSRNPKDNLSPDESASIHLYTSEWPGDLQSIYSLLNDKLRSENYISFIQAFLYSFSVLLSLKKRTYFLMR